MSKCIYFRIEVDLCFTVLKYSMCCLPKAQFLKMELLSYSFVPFKSYIKFNIRGPSSGIKHCISFSDIYLISLNTFEINKYHFYNSISSRMCKPMSSKSPIEIKCTFKSKIYLTLSRVLMYPFSNFKVTC